LCESVDAGNVACGIFLVLAKKFDTVNHKILLCKMEKYGVREIALNLFKTYY